MNNFLQRTTDKRWKRISLFTIGWLLVCFGGAELMLEHPKYNLEKGYWLAMGWSYFIALVAFMMLEAYLLKKHKTLYFLLGSLLILALYPIWGRILFELNDLTGGWFSQFLKLLEKLN